MTSSATLARPASYVLLVEGPDARGIVAAVTTFVADAGCSITESHHFNDTPSERFFTRTVFTVEGGGALDTERFQHGFEPIADHFTMTWSLQDLAALPRVLIAVSRFGHCLFDLMHRWRSGILPIDLVGVVSNHDEMRSFVEWSGIPYYYFPIQKGDKLGQEKQILALTKALSVDLVVLARYMQILSPTLCAALAGRCINIHHSFLPSFKGAKPYHQAHVRGVKLIGATAHYVTTDLDEGPIIEQGVERVTHAQGPEDLVTIGRDTECAVLARAVTWHAERRLVRHGQRVVVFK